jgi:photosystem II stability/assembly factor-like uncharacterized protein
LSKLSKYVILLVIIFSPDFYSQENFWEQIDTLKNESIFSIAVNSKGRIYAGSWLGKLYFSTNNGITWTVKNTASIKNLIYYLTANSNDHVFAGTIGGGFFRSTDEGNTWTCSGLSDHSVISIAVDSKNIIYAATGGRSNTVFQSTDNGDTWTQCDNGLMNTGINALAVNSKDYIFAGTLDGIFLSTDGGKSWAQKNNGLTNTSVYSLAVNSNDFLFAGTLHDGEIFFSTNSGDHWIQRSNNLNTSFVRSFAFHESQIYTGSYDGIFRSVDNGETWAKMNSGLLNKMVQSLVIDDEERIYAGTWGAGVYMNLDLISTYSYLETAPHDFALGQNYPNPFNPRTKIKYSVPVSVFVVIELYDIIGNKLAVLVNEEKSPGNYEIEFSAGSINLASGVYFYRMHADKFSSTKKFILLK